MDKTPAENRREQPRFLLHPPPNLKVLDEVRRKVGVVTATGR
jgi:hypothetical protein